MVYNYLVCWQESVLFPSHWKCKSFSVKKEAKAFLKKKRKEMKKKNIDYTKPYIVIQEVQRKYFRENAQVEWVKGKKN
jgi:hypothetical protein